MTDLAKPESRIAPWGDRADVREIANRVRLMAPGAKKLSENEALALAQGAVAHELDPFNGEIWYIPGSGLMAGIKGLRKAARKQLEEGQTFWCEFIPILDPDKRKLYQIEEGALAFEAELRDTQTLMTYSNAWKDLADSGIPVDVIPQVVGKQPFTLGVGIFEPSEHTKMKPVQCAMKRAEADAIKRRFDLPFATPTATEEDIIDVPWTEVVEEPVDEEELAKDNAAVFDMGEESAAVIDEEKLARDTALFYPDTETVAVPREDVTPRMENQWESDIIKEAIKLELAAHDKHAVNILNQSPFVNTPHGSLSSFEGIGYFMARAAVKKQFPDQPSEERAASVNITWEETKQRWMSIAADTLADQTYE